VSEGQLETLRRVRRNTISLEAPFPGPDDKAVEDTVADATLPSPVNSLYRHQVARAIPDLLPNLSGRERRVLRWRFGLDSERPHTLAEIGLKLELSRERVRQIEISSIEKLRHQLEERRLLETTDRETSP
jgi:RNA polymerase primary sigma factor